MNKMNYQSIRKSLFESEDIEQFFHILRNSLNSNEIKLPIQLLEDKFNFDFHRKEGIKHPIKQSVVIKFKENGFKIRKVRNKYKAKIKKTDD